MIELSEEQIEKNFADINPPLSEAEAVFEANRCLYCYDAPCMHACPTHIDVPAFIKKIASGNLHGSARVIFDANPIGGSCARVCPVEVLCEGACVEKTLMDKPIEIGRLQRYATDHAAASGRQIFQRGESNGKSVGIVGSGPAGLSCATYLARLGYDVTIYERKPLAGGLDTYGMAEYKMTQADSLQEVKMVQELGVKIHVNCEVETISELPVAVDGGHPNGVRLKVKPSDTADGSDVIHDAVFIGIGLGATKDLDIIGEDKDGVMDALHFIEAIKTRNWQSVPLGKTVAVIGAGNTAIDAVTQAKRLGAEKVMMIYRRTEKDISAYDYEFELAKKDGIEFVWQSSPVEILGNGRVSGLKCRKPDGSEFEIACDLVIKAIGQKKQIEFLRTIGLQYGERGHVSVNEHMQTSNPKIFAGGDCVNGGAEAVDAAQMGKWAAHGIHRHLSDEEANFSGLKMP